MCGFAGFLDLSPQRSREDNERLTIQMTDAIRHRGPDDSGLWGDIDSGISLGFRRLSIIDLSPNGHQPMLSACGRYTIVFNGEIYNFKTLKQEIIATGKFPFPFRGHSDTEVLLAAFTVWGIDTTLTKTNGMFAFALWDRENKSLSLSRDRIGEKPLYYGWAGEVFLFGSELRSFLQHPRFKAEIDRNALALYFRHNAFPAPYSVFKGIKKLPPGTFLTLSANKREGVPVPYWSAPDAIEKAKQNPYQGNFQEGVQDLEVLLKDSIKLRMESDVPLGAFLSGGIDSSTIVALMQAQSSRPIQTFTIGFKEDAYDEAKFAKKVAAHLGTNHTELYLSAEDSLKVVPHLGEVYDEPFADSSQIPTLLVSRLARKQVTVALSGDAGDELFAGYNRYSWGRTLWKRVGKLPPSARLPFSKLLHSFSPQTWNHFFALTNTLIPKKYRWSNPGDKLHKLAEILDASTREQLYLNLVSQWYNPESIVLNSHEPKTLLTSKGQSPKLSDITEMMMALDLVTYLPDDILVKVDRASMRESLEARVPLLDHRIIEFAWRLPLDFKVRQGQSKAILRELLYRYVPKEFIERPKMGFGVPIDTWLRGPLKEWAENLLSEERLKKEGLNSSVVRKAWQDHQSGGKNLQHRLWGVLMFQTWLDEMRGTLLNSKSTSTLYTQPIRESSPSL